MGTQTDKRQTPAPLPKTLLLVDHPNLITMEKYYGRSITPRRIMDLAGKRGRVVCPRVFTDNQRMTDWRQSRDWEHAGFDIHYCRRYGRPEAERTSQHQAVTKESVDVTLISHAYKMIEAIQPAQLILVAGDSDYVPLARDAVLNLGIAVRVFLTAKCGLMEPLLAEKVLTETYALYNLESPLEITTISLFQRISIQHKDVFTLSARDKKELDMLSEILVVCPVCRREVAIGLWKSHICFPSRTTDAQSPAAMNRLPGKEASGIEEPRSATCPQTTTADPPETRSQVVESDDEPVSTAEEPALSPESTLLSSVLQLNAERWERIRAAAHAIPRSDIAKIAAALKNISMEVSLAWIADDERVSRTQDEISALKRLIEKGAPCPAVIWQQTLLRIHDEFKEALTLPEAVHRLKIWSQGALFGDALALLIDEGVLQVTDDGLIARGSLVRPAFRFACSKSLLDAMPKTQNA